MRLIWYCIQVGVALSNKETVMYILRYFYVDTGTENNPWVGYQQDCLKDILLEFMYSVRSNSESPAN